MKYKNLDSEIKNKFISDNNTNAAKSFFYEAIDLGLDFKSQKNVRLGKFENLKINNFVEDLPIEGMPLEDIIDEFKVRYLPYSYNFSSPRFMGFPDAGNSVAAITANIITDLLQQNLINQSFCSPSGTFAEISSIRWLREVVGYKNPKKINDIFDVGGVITGGGTTSNAIGILLARENYRPDTMTKGVDGSHGYMLMVPEGIGHYSVKSAQMWIGCGNNLIEVKTNNYRYDIDDLRKNLKKYKGKIMGLVAYAGDSRTMTVDNFKEISHTVKESGQNIWLHADACHGFALGFSERLKFKLSGIEEFDSITTDPHKVLNLPYTLSALLVKNPQALKTTASFSDLIMQEQFAFGQSTPFIGSKPWVSLKLWFAIKNLGKKGFEAVINERHDKAVLLAEKLEKSTDFTVINKVDINSVGFLYHGNNRKKYTVEQINKLNRKIHDIVIEEGVFHIHQFSLPDAGLFKKGEIIYPLRFMSGNPNTTEKDLDELINYIRTIGERIKQ
jgi:L-2,4-diaminobutyrate decarboxylase